MRERSGFRDLCDHSKSDDSSDNSEETLIKNIQTLNCGSAFSFLALISFYRHGLSGTWNVFALFPRLPMALRSPGKATAIEYLIKTKQTKKHYNKILKRQNIEIIRSHKIQNTERTHMLVGSDNAA